MFFITEYIAVLKALIISAVKIAEKHLNLNLFGHGTRCCRNTFWEMLRLIIEHFLINM